MQNQTNLPCKAGMSNYVPYFDGIRGVAILLVALGHFFYEYYIFKIGWVGLNIFFILSGYLVTKSLFQYQCYSAQNYFLNFYGRRVLRIFPLYYGVLISFFFLFPAISQKFQFHFIELYPIQANYWLYLSNWQIILDGLPKQPVFFHFWSLAVEEQFYFIWPILFLYSSTTRNRYVLISFLFFLSIASRVMTSNPLHSYVNSLTAAEPLLLGSLLSIFQMEDILQKVDRKLIIGAILSFLFLCVVFFQNSDLHITNGLLMKYGYSAINIVIGSMVCSILVGNSLGLKFRILFSAKWLKWVGKYSYSIYVFHWIILKTVVYKLEAILVGNQSQEMIAYLIPRFSGIILTLSLSYCSYHCYENHFLALKRHFSTNRKWNFGPLTNYFMPKRKRQLAGTITSIEA
jgi:peptidoglycan/LPS O-acetylase OafA/YrhL